MLSATMISFSNLSVAPEAVVNFLKHEVHLKETLQKILSLQVIEQATQERGIVVTPEEIQAEADRQRYQQHLESAAETFAWLNEQLITPEDWETGIRNRLLRKKLAATLFDSEVEKYFAEHRLDFEKISLYRISVPYKQLAQELFYQIEENEISFYEAAHLYDIDERRRLHCGYEGQIARWDLSPELATLIFGSRPGEVIGPVQAEKAYDLLLVEEIITPELTPEIHQKIIDRLFQEWLDSEFNYFLHNH